MKTLKFLFCFSLLTISSLLVACGSEKMNPDNIKAGSSEQNFSTDVSTDEPENKLTYDWGIELLTQNITPTGLTIVCNQSGGNLTGELFTGSFYTLEILKDNEWQNVATLPQENEIAWTDEAFIVPVNGTTQWDENWEWLYGSLPSGKYRIGKNFMDFRETGDYDTEISAEMEEMTATMSEISHFSNTSSQEAVNMAAATEEQLASMEQIEDAAQGLNGLSNKLKEQLNKIKVSKE